MAKQKDQSLADSENRVDDEIAAKSESEAADVLDSLDTSAAASSTNTEVGAADTYVGSQKTSPSSRNPNAHAVIRNTTLQGMPADVHQAMVAVANHTRSHAAVHAEVSAVLDKYTGDDTISPAVRSHLEASAKALKPLAEVHNHSRKLLEANT